MMTKQSDNNGKVHLWHRCYHCGMSPIEGKRYECQSCPAGPERDLCSGCYNLFVDGKVVHPSTKSGFARDNCSGNFVACEPTGSKQEIEHWQNMATRDVVSPGINQRFIVRMEFRVGYESVFGGYGFAVNTPAGKVVLTALHVLDELLQKHGIDANIGNNTYSGKELPEIIDSVTLYDVLQDKWMFYELGSCDAMIVLPEARIGEVEPFSCLDISAFCVAPDASVDAAQLAIRCPEIGEAVWLAANMPEQNYTRKAVVVAKAQDRFVFRYDSETGLPRACSGAPILDKEGNVVAINVGTGCINGCRYGHGNHVDSIKTHLKHILATESNSEQGLVAGV